MPRTSANRSAWHPARVHRVDAPVSGRLRLGRIDDPLERQADRLAHAGRAGRSGGVGSAAQPVGGLETAPASVQAALAGASQALDGGLRRDMEQHLRADFSSVRVHTSVAAQRSALDIDALAYSRGPHLVFAPGQFRPGSAAGRQLIAHELAHVLQAAAAPDAAPVRRQPARPLPTPPTTVAPRAAPALEVIEGGLTRATARSAERVGWRQFWRVVARRFALRGATAIGLAAADGPLPIGDLIALGLTLWMIWDLVQIWDALWTEAAQEGDEQSAPRADPAAEPRREPRNDCRRVHPYALACGHDGDRDEAVIDFLMRQGFGPDDLGDCRGLGSFAPGAIDACGGAPGERWHCRVNGTDSEVSVFGCLCCDEEGATGFSWRGPHWSVNLSRRGR